MLAKESTISRHCPASSATTPYSAATSSSTACTSAVTLPKSRPSRLAVTSTTRRWSTRRISLAPSATLIAATADRGTATSPTVVTIKPARSSMVARSSGRVRTRSPMS